MQSLNNYIDYLNDNALGIVLQHEASKENINFLDLNVEVRDGALIITTYFKETDHDSFIDQDNCHHAMG